MPRQDRPIRTRRRSGFRLLVLLLCTAVGCSADTRDESASDSAEAAQSSSAVDENGAEHGTNGQDRSSIDSTEAPSIDRTAGSVSLSQTEYIVEDAETAASLRLYIRNTTGELSVIDRVDPSCGCIMTTVQRRNARPGDSAEIYIGFLPQEMSTTQPYTVDVYMTTDPSVPLRLTIWKREAYEHRNE